MASITSVGWSFLLIHLLMGSPTDCHVKEGWDFCLSGTQGAHIRNLRNDYTGACHLISPATMSLLSTCSLLMSPSSTLVSTANAHTQVPAHLQKGPRDKNQRPGAGRRWRPTSPLPKQGLISSRLCVLSRIKGPGEPAEVRGVPRTQLTS